MIIPVAKRLGNVEEYYFSKKLKEIKVLNDKGANIINLGIGSPDLPPSKATIDALNICAANDKSHGYQSYVGIPELRNAISTWMEKTYGVSTNPDNEILPLMGSKEGIMHISMTFLNEGDKVLVPNPGYPTYSSVSNLLGAQMIHYDLDENNNWAIDIQKLKTLPLDEVKLMWINFPNMPTGADYDFDTLQQLVDLAHQHKFLIINDNPYSLVLNPKPGSIFNIPGAKEVAIELNSLSKSHNMAGWRVGWLAGKSDYVNSVLRVKSNMDSGMFLGIQKAAVEAFNNSADWHQQQNEIYAERKKLVLKIFDYLNLSYNPNSVGMFVWGKIKDDKVDASNLVDKILYDAGVFITPGLIFGSNGNRYLRASLCANEEMIKEALVRIQSKL
jgi:LL-diaminopimelate aminotransferase